MLQFDAKTTQILDDGYQGSDVTRRRLANLRELAPEPGETIVDIGCGTGLLTLDLARAVGGTGNVIGIDPSAEMRSVCEKRCSDRTNVEIIEGTVESLPLEDNSVDGAVSLQVFEYVSDIAAALKEVSRVLRPGGRLVVGDFHWDSHIWHSDNIERMTHILRIWDQHLTERRVPALLSPLLRQAGFEVVSIVPELFQDTVFRADGLAQMLTHLISAYAHQNELADPNEIKAWISEQQEMAAEGRFFFAITHYVVSARIPC
jgi:arsenite methyltransferase